MLSLGLLLPPSGTFTSGLTCEVRAFAVTRVFENGQVWGVVLGLQVREDDGGSEGSFVTAWVDTSDNGATWAASNGHYGMSSHEGKLDFLERLDWVAVLTVPHG